MAYDTVGEPVLIHAFSQPVRTTTGQVYAVAAYGQQRRDGAWIGWLAFTPSEGAVLRTDRETTQPSHDDLAYWASGLEPVYLEGAFSRAR
jgi:hypothetical protein